MEFLLKDDIYRTAILLRQLPDDIRNMDLEDMHGVIGHELANNIDRQESIKAASKSGGKKGRRPRTFGEN